MASSENTFRIYPFAEYKGWTYFPNPDVEKDAEKRFQLIKNFEVRESDVIFCTAPKSGTHWVHEILSMLLSQTTVYNTQWDGNFLEMLFEFMRKFDEIEVMKGPRIFWTHLPFSFLPKQVLEQGNRIVCLNRNPKDRAVSMFTWLDGKNGIPSVWKWSDFFDKHVLNDTMHGGWFRYTRDMLDAYKNQKGNIFPLLYEDLHRNPISCVTSLADFLKVPYTDEFIQEIIKKCAFKELKEQKEDASIWVEPQGRKTIFRKGEIGDWKNWFTVAQNEEFDKLYDKEMRGVDIKFTYE